MFAEYIQASLRHAKYEILEDDTYISTVEGLQGVIAIGDSIEECRQDLIEVIERMNSTATKDGRYNPFHRWRYH